MSAESKVLWIELVSRQGDVVARHRVECTAGEAIHVGRGYDNHVVLDDPYVAARHLRIAPDESGALVAEDLGSANGLFVNKDRRRTTRALLESTPTLRIGRTRLRIRQAGDAVPAERIARPRMQLWPVVTVLALAVLGGEFLTMWLRETTEQKPSDYLGPLLAMCASIAVWAAAWAIGSRIFSGRARFERHLLIALSGLAALWLVNEVSSYAAFAWSRREFAAYRYIPQWVLGAYILFLHLRQVNLTRESGARWLKLNAGAAALLAAIAIGMETLSRWEGSQHSDRQTYLRGLKPPTFRLARAESPGAFFSEAASLQGTLDRARSEAHSRTLGAGDEDE